MQTKNEFQVSIKKMGILNNDIFRLIAFNNEGNDNYSLGEIHSYLKLKRAELPASLVRMEITQLYNEIIIMEDGKNITLIIQQINDNVG
jgi:hypothetical protein